MKTKSLLLLAAFIPTLVFAQNNSKGTVGNGGNGGKGGAGSVGNSNPISHYNGTVGNSKAPKGPAEPGTALVQPDGQYRYTPTATAPKSASQGRPTGDTANDLKAPAPPK